jgi:hypothetical protein
VRLRPKGSLTPVNYQRKRGEGEMDTEKEMLWRYVFELYDVSSIEELEEKLKEMYLT